MAYMAPGKGMLRGIEKHPNKFLPDFQLVLQVLRCCWFIYLESIQNPPLPIPWYSRLAPI